MRGTELGGGLPKNPRGHGIEQPYWGPSLNDSLLQFLGPNYRSPVVIRFWEASSQLTFYLATF